MAEDKIELKKKRKEIPKKWIKEEVVEKSPSRSGVAKAAETAMEKHSMILVDWEADDSVKINKVELMKIREITLGKAVRGEEVWRTDLTTMLRSEQQRVKVFGAIDLREFRLGTSDEAKEQRSDQIVRLIGAGHLKDAIDGDFWISGEDGRFGEVVWKAADKMRNGMKLDELTEEEYNAWAILRGWGEVLETEGGVDPRKTLLKLQEMLDGYGVSVESFFAEDGAIRMKDGKSLKEQEKELKRLNLRSNGHFQLGEKTVRVEKEKKKKKEDELIKESEVELVHLGDLIMRMGEWQVGEVVDAYLSTQMNKYLNPDFGGDFKFPVNYTRAEKGPDEGLVFEDIKTPEWVDLMKDGLTTAGYFEKWEVIARLCAVMNAIRFGFHENKLDKQWLESIPALSSASMALTLSEVLPGFAEAVMSGVLTGVRHEKTGARSGAVMEEQNGKWIIRAPKGEEKAKPLQMNVETRMNLRKVLADDGDLQKKIKEKGMKYQPWVVEIAHAYLWATGDGIEIPWTPTKMRESELIVYYCLGAMLQIFYEWPDSHEENDFVLRATEMPMSNKLAEIDRKNGWKAGTAAETAFDILRWATPAMVPFASHLAETLKLNPLNPYMQDLLHSQYFERFPAYEDRSKIDWSLITKNLEIGGEKQEVTPQNIHKLDDPMKLDESIRDSDEYKRILMMRALKFKGPYKDIEAMWKKDILRHWQRSWQVFFATKYGNDKRIRGQGGERAQRRAFNYKNDSHVQLTIREVIDKIDGSGQRKLELLKHKATATVEEIRYLFDNEEVVLPLANELHKRMGWDLDIEKYVEKMKKDVNDKVGVDGLVKAVILGDVGEVRKYWGLVTKLSDTEIKEVINGVKLELVLRDPDSWGMRADMTESTEKGWKKVLLKKALGQKGSIDELHYKWSYNYSCYKLLAYLIFDWPEMLKTDGPAVALEKLRNSYHEYGRAAGMTYHPINVVQTMVMYLTVAQALVEVKIGSGDAWIKRPYHMFKRIRDAVDATWLDPKKVSKENMKYLQF